MIHKNSHAAPLRLYVLLAPPETSSALCNEIHDKT